LTTAGNWNRRADVVVVGGGSAGATLAARLSQDPNRHVLLLEAGQAFEPDEVPAPLSNADNVAAEAFDWGYTARGGAYSPEIPVARGRVLGGSSAVNAAVAIRARRSDIEGWGLDGVDGWSWDDVLATFKAIENTDVGDDAYHGRSGPLSIRQRTSDDLTPGLLGFIDAAVADGYKRVEDFNGNDAEGADGYPVNIVDGIRQSSAAVYLTDSARTSPSWAVSSLTSCSLTARQQPASSALPVTSTRRTKSFCRQGRTGVRRSCCGPVSAPRENSPNSALRLLQISRWASAFRTNRSSTTRMHSQTMPFK
jgi:choline dehydrogenase-like flavoprotein